MASKTVEQEGSVSGEKALSRPLDALIDLFRDQPSDDRGGIQAVRGFGFQIWQAVVEALEAHITTHDYAVVSEWKQDIAVLNDSRVPTQIKFIQSKKSEAISGSNWTLASLHSAAPEASSKMQSKARKKPSTANKASNKTTAPPQSILSKLYIHRARLESTVSQVELVFSTNSAFLMPSSDGNSFIVDDFELTELPVVESTKLTNELATQLGVDATTVKLERIFLRRSVVPLDEPHHAVAGMLARFSEQGLITPTVVSPFVTVCIMASYVTLKTGKRAYAKDLPTLLQRAITRGDVAHYIAATNSASISTLDLIERTVARLDQENEDPDISRDMRATAQAVFARLTDPRATLWTTVKDLLQLYRFNAEFKDVGKLLSQRFESWFKIYVDTFDATDIPRPPLAEIYCLMALIYHDAREIKHLSATQTDSKSPKE